MDGRTPRSIEEIKENTPPNENSWISQFLVYGFPPNSSCYLQLCEIVIDKQLSFPERIVSRDEGEKFVSATEGKHVLDFTEGYNIVD